MLQPGQVLDVPVDNASERGLLGIAIHPSFPTAPFVYLYYTQSDTAGDTSGSPSGKSSLSLYMEWERFGQSEFDLGFAGNAGSEP